MTPYFNYEALQKHVGGNLFPATVEYNFGFISEEKAHLLIAFPIREPTWERIGWKLWLADK